ncbi:MAG: hypothetical protein JZU55_01210, partial [Afipia sp.]|nr:hypothetical protein [Afipia sp.]
HIPGHGRKNGMSIQCRDDLGSGVPGDIDSGFESPRLGRFAKTKHLIEEMAGIPDHITINNENARMSHR